MINRRLRSLGAVPVRFAPSASLLDHFAAFCAIRVNAGVCRILCEPKLEHVKALLAQKPDDKNKIYALHAPE